MAYTVSSNFGSVFGDKRIMGLRITTDAATQAVFTGLANIDWGYGTPQSGAGHTKFVMNQLASGTASAGYVAISGATSGDILFVTVFGR